jgi:hypothetical protein
MEQPNRPTSNASSSTAPSSSHWEPSNSRRQIVPAVVIGVAVVALFGGMDYKFKHDKPSGTTLALAQAPAEAPAVESASNEAPAAVDSGTAATVVPTAVEMHPPRQTDSTRASPATEPPPAPVTAPRRDINRAKPQPFEPIPTPAPAPRPSVSESPAAPPVQAPVTEPEATSTAPQPAVQPAPEPAPVN